MNTTVLGSRKKIEKTLEQMGYVCVYESTKAEESPDKGITQGIYYCSMSPLVVLYYRGFELLEAHFGAYIYGYELPELGDLQVSKRKYQAIPMFIVTCGSNIQDFLLCLGLLTNTARASWPSQDVPLIFHYPTERHFVQSGSSKELKQRVQRAQPLLCDRIADICNVTRENGVPEVALMLGKLL